MKFINLQLLIFFLTFNLSARVMGIDNKSKKNPVSSTDTLPSSLHTATGINSKVMVSSSDNSLEITPLSSFNNGLLIQPVNRNANKGVNTSFYFADTASWDFYTDSQKRLGIDGKGYISIGKSLLINNALPDNESTLKVNGIARFDSLVYIQGFEDTNSFISFSRNVKRSTTYDEYDGSSAYTTTPTGWAANANIPVFRIRHPRNVASNGYINQSLQRDFMILPYQYGTAIEYNGVVECWVGEWSIHRGLVYYDVEGKGNGWGGVLWIGDDGDVGGIRITGRNNIPSGGNVAYGELSYEKFGGAPHGDFRLRLPSTENQFQFVYGERGSENVVAKMTNQGLILPKVSSVAATQAPEKAQVVFDSTDNKFKGYSGTGWEVLSGEEIKTGSYSTSGDNNDIIFTIPHALGTTPSYFNVVATSEGAANISYVTASPLYLLVHYNTAPPSGINNLSWNWQVKR